MSYTTPNVTETMTFDEALENLIARYENIESMSYEEARAFARESAVIERHYPEGFTMTMAQCCRSSKTGEFTEETTKLMENERVAHLVSLVHRLKDKLVR